MAHTFTIKRDYNGSTEKRGDKIIQVRRATIQVETDPEVAPLVLDEVLRLPEIPIVGQTHWSPKPGFLIPFCICKKKSAKRHGDKERFWLVDCEFNSETDQEQDPKDEDDNPLDFDPVIEPLSDVMEIAGRKDFNNKVIANPLGELYAEPVLFPIPLAGVRVSRYVLGQTEWLMQFWRERLNNATWRTGLTHTWCIRDCELKPVKWKDAPADLALGTWTIMHNPIQANVDGVVKQVGWYESRQRVATFYKRDDGTFEDFRTNHSFAKLPYGNVDIDGKRIPAGDPPEFDWFRNRRDTDFSVLVPS